MNRNLAHTAVVTVLACSAFAQAPAFDAVSVKPNKSGSGSSSSNSHEGVFTGTNQSLKRLIMRAYMMREFQIFGPDWLDNERFDVSGKPPSGTPPEQLPLMIKAMLADRFKLALHSETRVSNVYGLVLGKGGPKFKPGEGSDHNTNSNRGKFEGKPCSMENLATFLAGQLDRPVVDMTGLSGVYQVILQWTPDDAQREEAKPEKDAFPPLLTALQEQLGLKLEPKKAPLEVLVVDHVERVPTEN